MTLRQKVASTSQPSSVPVCTPHDNMQIRDMCSVYPKIRSAHFRHLLITLYSSKLKFWLRVILYNMDHAWGYTPLAVVSRARKTLRVSFNHCWDSANSGCFVERGRCDRLWTSHVFAWIWPNSDRWLVTHCTMPSIGQTWVLASIGAVVEMGILSTLKRLLMESSIR
jgi:hypothetical protein